MNAYLGGTGDGDKKFGYGPALRVAQDLGIPVLALTGEEARRASQFLGIPLDFPSDASMAA